MWLRIVQVLLFVGVLHPAPVEKDEFGNENFLENTVEKPRVHQSETEPRETTDGAKELEKLLYQLFDKFPKQEPSSDEVEIGKNGKAYEKKKLVPNQKYTDKKETSASDYHTNNAEEKNELSLKELEKDVEHLLEKIKGSTKEEISKKDVNNEYKFETYHEEEEDNQNNDFEKFKEKFVKVFLDEKAEPSAESSKERKEQTLIGTGKEPPYMIGTGKDNRNTQLNELYEELRTETTAHVEKQQKKDKMERIDPIIKDFLDSLNKSQKRETFTYENGKFGLSKHKDPLLVNTGKDHHVSELGKSDELQESDNHQEENTKYEESKKNMENVFLDIFKRVMEKKKKTSEESEKEETHTVKKDSLRSRLLNLIDQLDQQIKNEQKRVVADEKQISQLEKDDLSNAKRISSRRNSLENELDEILNGLKRSTKNDWGSDKETIKALQGFNVEEQNGKSSRP